MEISFILRPIAIIPAICSIALLISMVFFLLKGKMSVLLRRVILLQFSAFLWNFGQVIQCISANESTTLLSIFPIHTALSFAGYTWLIFCMSYINFDEKEHRFFKLILFVLPFFNFLLFLTNPLHGKYFISLGYHAERILTVTYGELFWLTPIITYLYMIIGLIILIYNYYKNNKVEKAQIILFTIIGFSMLSFSLGVSANIFKNRGSLEFFDFSPAVFALLMVTYSIIAFKYKFVSIYPKALRTIIDNIDESILVFDRKGIAVNFNPSFESKIGQKINVAIGEKSENFANKLQCVMVDPQAGSIIIEALKNVDAIDKIEDFAAQDIAINNDKLETYKVSLLKVLNKRNQFQGFIVTFNEITEYIILHQQLKQKNNELTGINKALNQHLKVIEELTIAKERIRVARKMHDTLGHTLTVLILILKECRIKCFENADAVMNKMNEGLNIATESLHGLRNTIKDLVDVDIKVNSLIVNIEKIVQDVRKTDINIELNVVGEEFLEELEKSERFFEISELLQEICMEGVTNSIKHGHSTYISITLRLSLKSLELFIIDNGRGCDKITDGFGLSNIKKRVGAYNGLAKFKSSSDSGFVMQIQLQVSDLSD